VAAKYAKLPRTNATTSGVWVIGRIYVEGQKDLQNVMDLWSKFKIEPVNPGQKKPTMLASTATTAYNLMGKPEPADIGRPNATTAFVAMAGMIKAFPPVKEDMFNLTKAARAVNLDLLRGFDQPRVNAAQAAVYTAGYQLGINCMNSFVVSGQSGKPFKYGWTVSGLFMLM
jgi:hypothetical protein